MGYCERTARCGMVSLSSAACRSSSSSSSLFPIPSDGNWQILLALHHYRRVRAQVLQHSQRGSAAQYLQLIFNIHQKFAQAPGRCLPPQQAGYRKRQPRRRFLHTEHNHCAEHCGRYAGLRAANLILTLPLRKWTPERTAHHAPAAHTVRSNSYLIPPLTASTTSLAMLLPCGNITENSIIRCASPTSV